LCQRGIARIELFNPVKFTIAENPVLDDLTIQFTRGIDADESVIVEIINVFGQNCDLTPTLSTSEEGVRIDVSV